MSKLSKILLSETILIERQYFVKSLAKANEVSMASEINSLTSSKAINAGRMMTKGAEVHMFGCVGKDEDGKRAFADLEDYGIKPTLVTTTDRARTGEVVVMTKVGGDSAFTVFLGANQHSDLGLLKNLHGFDFVYAASSMDLRKLYKLIDTASRAQVGIFLDFPNQQKEFDKRYLRNVGFTVPNRHEAELLLGISILTVSDAIEAAKKLKKFTNGNVVITLDNDGCIIFGSKKDGVEHIPAKKIKVIDTTASGDIFRGVLLSEYLRLQDLESATKKAVEVATESCRIKGVDKSIRHCQKLV